MFSHSIPEICCITDVEFSIKIASQNVNIIHISSSSGALNYVEFGTNHEPYMVHGVVHEMAPCTTQGTGLAMHLTWCMAEREGFEPSIPF